jgi:molybdate transport system ATP-binding protein
MKFKATKMLHTAQGRQSLDISFELEKGRLLTLYGPSGAGKTTILRILSGLTEPSAAMIEVDGTIWEDTARKIHLPTRRRSIGFVFQDFALFPHLTVKQQLEFALQKGDDKAIVTELLALMELEELQDRRPAFLSGGQQQRVALARAIARRPKLLLLDEPLSALDDEMRFKLQDYILKAHRYYQLTTLLVSHYLPEILRLSDEVICLEKGQVSRQGAPSQLFPAAARSFSAGDSSGAFRISGEIMDIMPAGTLFIISVGCDDAVVKVIATTEEAAGLHIGQKVIIASKAFNPVILPSG